MNKIQIKKVESNEGYIKVKGYVTVKGSKYKFTVLEKKENKISEDSWKVIAKEAAKIALNLINEKTLYKATVVLSGISDNPNSSIEPNIGVKEVKVKKKESSKFKKLKINSNKIDENIKRICEELKNPGSTKKTDKASSIPKIKIADDGKCLDRSIAYQILAKENPNVGMKTNDERISQLADDLRTQVANKIQNDQICDTEEFFNLYLLPSIRTIPAFSDEDRYKNENGKTIKEQSKTSILQLVGENHEFDEIQAMLKGSYNTSNQDERKKLRDFYAQFITQTDVNNKNSRNNYLDSAFLYVLAYVEVNGKKHEYAILSENKLQAGKELLEKFPKHTELKADNTIFVLYNGDNHYDAVDMNKAGEKINEIIADYNNTIVAHLFTISKESNNSYIIQAYLLNNIKNQVPEAYKAIADYIYWYDHAKWKESVEALKKWEESDHQTLPKPNAPLDEPGTKLLTHESVNYSPEQYGDYRLHAIQPNELKLILEQVKDLQTLKRLAQDLKAKESEQK